MVVTLVDGVRVVVPDSLDLITPYVLLEQEDWFEDEIRFLRRLLRPGQKVLDIGASYGVYTLSMAQAVGPTGHVWAFEPASLTAEFLATGIAANGFEHVTLERSALSSASGAARLLLHEHSELNTLVHGEPPPGRCETVSMSTLDDCRLTRAWQDTEFVKIDAEGEEANILKGGTRFFAEQSPLVQFEIKTADEQRMDLVPAFAGMGYDAYRLAPGLDLLVPFDAQSPPDPFLLNLYCCKRDRAAQLAVAGFLVKPSDDKERKDQLSRAQRKANTDGAYSWRETLTRLPYGARLAESWERTTAGGRSAAVEEALALYAVSRDATVPAAERYLALEAGFDRLKVLCRDELANLRLASFARMARDYGARALAVDALAQLCKLILRHNEVSMNEPFLAPGERFDSITPGAAFRDWILAAALEEFERIGSYSSFYTGASAQGRLETIRDLGYGGMEMRRRLDLLQKRLAASTS